MLGQAGTVGTRAAVSQRLSRRAFVFQTLAAGVGVLAARGRTQTRMPFVSLNGSLTGKIEWTEFVRLAGRVGYGGVDVNLEAARRHGAEETRALLGEAKVKPTVASLPVRFAGDEAAYRDGLGQLPEVAAFLAEIGCPRMMAVMPPSSATPKVELRKLVKDRLTEISAILLRSKIRLALEFLGPLHFRTRQPHEFIWRMDELLELTQECGPNAGMVLDAWHWHHAGATAADILEAGTARIFHVHVSDAKAQPPEDVRDNQRLMPGEGVIDLTTFFQALKKIGYADGISPEPLGRVTPDMPAEQGARLGLETTLAAMKKAGVL
ncbi:MAG TPA: sugar phosphate isomerase/epimerase family protein [Vicinamibacterales bacterium]|nr:sugar phosphate isomerase/epimerase family protein [Vicinamibacterales bacterium]